MREKRTPFGTRVVMAQPPASVLTAAQSQVMSAAKRVDSIDVEDRYARERALAGLMLKKSK